LAPSFLCLRRDLHNLASWKESQFRGRGRLFYRCCECRKFVDTLAHSHLPKLRMPLAHIHKAMEHYFQGAVPPTVEELGHRLGHDAASSTCQTPELLDARRSQMRGMDAERPRSLRTAIAAPHPKKKCRKHVQSHASVIMFLRWHIM
jgi:hypothetical protein